MLYRNIYIFVCVFIISITIFITSMKFFIYQISSNIKGPKILLIGGTHGNEEAGSLALNKLIHLHKIGQFSIKRGNIIIIPNFNKIGLLFNSRYYSKISKNYDLNRLYGTGFTINKHLEKIVKDRDIVVDLHEGWGFHRRDVSSIGSTIITDNVKKSTNDFIINRLNTEIKVDFKKFQNIKKKFIPNTLRHFIVKNYPTKKFFLVETSGQGNIQKLHIRVNQDINILESILSIYDILQ